MIFVHVYLILYAAQYICIYLILILSTKLRLSHRNGRSRQYQNAIFARKSWSLVAFDRWSFIAVHLYNKTDRCTMIMVGNDRWSLIAGSLITGFTVVCIYVGYGPLYNPYKCCLGVCLATCRSLNNVYTATSICMARNTVRPVHHLDC